MMLLPCAPAAQGVPIRAATGATAGPAMGHRQNRDSP
jgi:hypothetical protein